MRSNAGRAKAAIISFWFVIFGLMLNIGVNALFVYFLYSFQNNLPISEDFMVLSRKFSFISILLLLITLLICAILFILWLTRAYRNLHHRLPNSKKKYPYWFAAVAWYIPFFNLIAPYNIATDLFDKTERYLLGMGYMDLRPKYDIIKGWWWATFIASIILVVFSERYMMKDVTSVKGPVVHIIGYATAIVSAFFAIKMIKNYREMEELIKQIETGSANFQLKEGDLLD